MLRRAPRRARTNARMHTRFVYCAGRCIMAYPNLFDVDYSLRPPLW